MKCFILTVFLSAVALEAVPYMGYGGGIGLGLGLGGMSSGQAGYANGAGYGGQQYNEGAGGLANQQYHNAGAGGFHNRGQHHNSLTSITQAEQSDMHDIGSGNAFDTGAAAGNGFNNYENGASQYGNQFGQGQMGQQSMFG